MHTEDPYIPPTPAPSAVTPASLPLKTDRTIRKWLTVLLIYPALDIGLPAIGSLLSGRHIHLGHMVWPLVSALLIGAVVLTWKAHSKLLLLALPAIFLAFGFTSALPALSLTVSFVLVLVLFFRIPKAKAGT